MCVQIMSILRKILQQRWVGSVSISHAVSCVGMLSVMGKFRDNSLNPGNA